MANLKAIESWSTTKASNDSTDSPQANMPDNLNAAEYKEVIRGLKASAAATIKDIGGFDCITTGTSTAYVLAQARDLDTAANGILTMFTPHTNCGADPTLAVADIAATVIKTQTGVALVADDLVSGSTYLVRLNTTATPDEWRLCGVIAAEATDAVQALLGTSTDVLTGTSTKAITGDALWDAAAIVSVTMDNAMEIDLAAGFLFKASATLNTNSTISFANTTGKAGRTIQFKFTCDGTARTLTFPSGSVTDGGFATLTKEFALSSTHKCYCTIDEDGVYDWSFRSDIKAAA
jgi:hypothetical protein